MSEDAPIQLQWSAQFTVAPSSRTPHLPGDKLLLPPSALEQLLAAAPVVTTQSTAAPRTAEFDPYNPYSFAAERYAREQFQDRQQQLPHPLTFRLVNPENGKVVYAGIREFSAEDGEVVLGKFLRESLGVEETEDEPMSNGIDTTTVNGKGRPAITVHAKQLPKGTFVKLRPLEAGYDPADWKSLLEQHMRANFTTLTNGEILVVPGGRGVGGKEEEFRFLIDGFKPEGDGICVVDTDLEVDIEALNEEQARETLKRIMAKAQRAPGTDVGSSTGGTLDLMRLEQGQVLPGEYVDYEVPSWIRAQGLEIELTVEDDDEDVDLYVSPFSARQRARPRADEYVFADVSSRSIKKIKLPPTNIELEDAEKIWVSVHAFATEDVNEEEKTPLKYQIRASPYDPNTSIAEPKGSTPSATPPNPDDVQCKNCQQWVPSRTLFLHENFCLRNNILCPHGCGLVFQKRSPSLQNHWHCPHDTFHGNTLISHHKHDLYFHTTQPCPSCSLTFTSLALLAHHRTTTCPGKLHLCQFCHLEVPQEGDPSSPDPAALLANLTPHELADGARTTECHLCNKIIRLRDMQTHLKHHDFERFSRPTPRLCRNVNCGRTLDGASKTGDTRANARTTGLGQGGNEIGVCGTCFGPLYVSMYDPDGKALRRRVERRYLSQLVSGCGKTWCRNEMCKSGRKVLRGEDVTLGTKDALPLVRPFVKGLEEGTQTPLHFCVDEQSQKRRMLAEMLAAEGAYGLEWCVAALEAENGDLEGARRWLAGWAPRREEVS